MGLGQARPQHDPRVHHRVVVGPPLDVVVHEPLRLRLGVPVRVPVLDLAPDVPVAFAEGVAVGFVAGLDRGDGAGVHQPLDGGGPVEGVQDVARALDVGLDDPPLGVRHLEHLDDGGRVHDPVGPLERLVVGLGDGEVAVQERQRSWARGGGAGLSRARARGHRPT